MFETIDQINLSYVKPGIYEETRFEKLHNVIFQNSEEGSKEIAREISNLVRTKQQKEENCVLGLATGSSPLKIYEELIRMHREEDLSFSNVVFFNLDEYFPIDPDDSQSYHHFMAENLFKYIDVKEENIHIPEGNISYEELHDYCNNYENRIQKLGGIDFQLLGIGRSGHIGFNEPGSHLNSQTRIITLDHITRSDAISAFTSLEKVPRKAITMGINTILQAKRIVLMAWGRNKAKIVKKAIEGEISSNIPATYLQHHQNTTVVLDKAASSELTRIREPWIIGDCNWDNKLKKEAVIWLCEHLNKPVLKLTDKDYNMSGMSGLLNFKGPAYDLNIEIFNLLQNTITGWPGGKPNSPDSHRPERSKPDSKNVVVFSLAPETTVAHIGGTMHRLVEQGHKVNLLFGLTEDSISTEEYLKYAGVFKKIMPADISEGIIEKICPTKEGQMPSGTVKKIKEFIRIEEILTAVKNLGILETNIEFINIPGKNNELSEKETVEFINVYLNKINPHQIFTAGDFKIPHGIEKRYLDHLINSTKNLQKTKSPSQCWIWLYNESNQDWKISDVDMAIPLSPDQVLKKRNVIFKFLSQKERILFQGPDTRKFYLDSENRNRSIAEKYHKLGLTEYEAMEVFKKL